MRLKFVDGTIITFNLWLVFAVIAAAQQITLATFVWVAMSLGFEWWTRPHPTKENLLQQRIQRQTIELKQHRMDQAIHMLEIASKKKMAEEIQIGVHAALIALRGRKID